MRELKPWQPSVAEEEDGVVDDIVEVAARCRYRDCRHEAEPGCAVLAATASGELAAERVGSWKKLEQERAARSARQERFAAVEQRRLSRPYTTEQRKRRG